MWKKMTRQGGGVEGVYDAVALRAVLKAKRLAGETEEEHEERSKQLCYHVSVHTVPHLSGCTMVHVNMTMSAEHNTWM